MEETVWRFFSRHCNLELDRNLLTQNIGGSVIDHLGAPYIISNNQIINNNSMGKALISLATIPDVTSSFFFQNNLISNQTMVGPLVSCGTASLVLQNNILYSSSGTVLPTSPCILDNNLPSAEDPDPLVQPIMLTWSGNLFPVYSLQMGSPAIDKSSPLSGFVAIPSAAWDFFGSKRPIGAARDIGATEYPPPSPAP